MLLRNVCKDGGNIKKATSIALYTLSDNGSGGFDWGSPNFLNWLPNTPIVHNPNIRFYSDGRPVYHPVGIILTPSSNEVLTSINKIEGKAYVYLYSDDFSNFGMNRVNFKFILSSQKTPEYYVTFTASDTRYNASSFVMNDYSADYMEFKITYTDGSFDTFISKGSASAVYV